MTNVVKEHFANATQSIAHLRFAQLREESTSAFDEWCRRADANLDGLRIAGKAVLNDMQATMRDEPEAAGVIALLLAEAQDGRFETRTQAVEMLHHDSLEIRQAAWWGLRLASSLHVEQQLRSLLGRRKWDFASAAALDILAFHRLPVQSELGRLPEEDGDEIAWLLAEACGRMRGVWHAGHLKQFLGHASPRVREAALRASARCGLAELPGFCREATRNSTPLEAIEFLGVVGCPQDLPSLHDAARSSTDVATAKAALNGIGRLGMPSAVPALLEFLTHPELADFAAAAIERITGQPLPRGDPPEPPPGLTEDDLDLWEPRAPVDVPRAREWWKRNAGSCDPGKRHQAGLCVSDAPLGPVFDQLPLAIRYDVYLRERALTSGTPDWELETWTWKQRKPGG